MDTRKSLRSCRRDDQAFSHGCGAERLWEVHLDGAALAEYAMRTGYATAEKARFANGEIVVEADRVCFLGEESVNSYTVALFVNFLQDECIN